MNLQTLREYLETARSYEEVMALTFLIHRLPTNLGCVLTTPPMAARAISPENHKYKSKIHPDYVKIISMISQKSHSLKLFLWKNIFVVGAGFCAAFLGLSINANEASALFTLLRFQLQ